MGSLRGETMAVRRHVVYPMSANPAAVRRDILSSSSTVRPNDVMLLGGAGDGRAALHHQSRSSSSSQGLQSASPSPSPSSGSGSGPRSTTVRGQTAAAVMTGYEQGLRGPRGVVQNGWTTRARLTSDVFTFASDTEACTSPAPHRYNVYSRASLCHYQYYLLFLISRGLHKRKSS